jgi:DNA polymerase III subunit epsilon
MRGWLFTMKDYGFPPFKLTDAVDTLLIARRKFPGQPANLDALCRRFNIDLSGREFHGALLDAQLLADVYLELTGGRQHGLGLHQESRLSANDSNELHQKPLKIERQYRTPREFPLTKEEERLHGDMVKTVKGSLWQ